MISISLPMLLSVTALGVSIFSFWYNSVRRGVIKMTQPTMIGIGFGVGGRSNQIFVRAMLFATASRGCVVENMYARVKRGESSQNFSIWVHGQPNDMERGAGLAVTQNGTTKNFHFLLRPDEPNFELKSGLYEIDIICRILGVKPERVLINSRFTLTPDLIQSDGVSVQFDWAPDSQQYIGHTALKRDNAWERNFKLLEEASNGGNSKDTKK